MSTQTLPQPHSQTFRSAEETWFWLFNPTTSMAIHRPCTKFDLYKLVERLYRQRHLTWDHMRVLGEYGRRQICPDPHRRQERRAHYFWIDAMERLAPSLEQAGIVRADIPSNLIDLALRRAMKGIA